MKPAKKLVIAQEQADDSKEEHLIAKCITIIEKQKRIDKKLEALLLKCGGRKEENKTQD